LCGLVERRDAATREIRVMCDGGKRLEESDYRKTAAENRRQSRRSDAPAGSQPEIFLGTLQRTQREREAGINEMLIVKSGKPLVNHWFARDDHQQVRKTTGFLEITISQSLKPLVSRR